MKPLEVVEQESQRQAKATSFLATLTLGHMVVHWYHQLWPMIIPSLKTGLGITDVQLGALSSVRQFTTGPLTLPSGMLADFFRKRTALIFAAAFIFLGLSHFLLAQAPTFFWIIPSIALVGIGSALWHPAALGSISLRFPERRASAISIHGIGASVGDTIAPLVVGSLLRGTLKKCVNGQAVSPLSEQDGLKAQEEIHRLWEREALGAGWSQGRSGEQLEDWVRGHVQRLIQELLEEEVTEFLGRAKSARRPESDNETGYRNGYGRPRRLRLSSGTIQLRRPRVRNTEEEFESVLLPLFVNRTQEGY